MINEQQWVYKYVIRFIFGFILLIETNSLLENYRIGYNILYFYCLIFHKNVCYIQYIIKYEDITYKLINHYYIYISIFCILLVIY